MTGQPRVRIEYPPALDELCEVCCFTCGWRSRPIFPSAALRVADEHECKP